ncbi:single-stranded DNA-binding protein [Kocuria tytonicola]|uniref:single-stranded DNA-binding protein n=1 Tax=Kocuria tytonicola TaxID=2055946 RepID=UPI000EF92265|nr:single-stranded DNA-binding protein [Kocuria tytonicola]RLZ04382.1 single-stranded DNA-binding protein [Kocuria tytonicola]
MSEHITLRGFVGKDPESHLFEDGTMVARFRLATTSRRFDAATNAWHDTSTNWYTVRCFRSLAMHVMASVRCGHPVVVTGKLGINEWQSENGPRTVVQVDAAAVGHDLSFGTANFSRSSGRAQRQDAQDGGTHEGTRTGGGSNPEARGTGATRDGGGTGPGEGQGRAGTEPGEDRYRDAQALGLAEEGFVDLESGAVLAVARDDDTFRDPTGGTRERGTANGDPGRSCEDAAGTDADGGDADQEAAKDRAPAVASH